MNSMVRKVLARYFERPGEYAPDQNMSWMEYLDDKTKAYDPGDVVKDMIKDKERLNQPFNVTNPYESENPSEMPKDQKDSPPFENDIDTPTMFGTFNSPNNYGDQGPFKEWNESRREDYTQDEDEQQPAISLTRKKLASEGIPESYLDSFSVDGSDFFNFVMRSKVAASINQIMGMDRHYKNPLKIQRASRCTVVWSNKNNPNQFEKGLFIFRVSTPGSKNRAHNVYIQFLRSENSAATEYEDYTVHIGCTCPSFLYSGAQYYAVEGGYMYMPAFKPDLVAPKMQTQYTVSVSQKYPRGRKNPGRGLNSRVCKHVLAVFEEIKKMPKIDHYKKYPIYSPPNAKIDSKAWEQMMKFPFTEEEIKKRLLSSKPVVPAYFNRESLTPSVIDWFKNTWFPRTDSQKIKSLNEFKMFPERVFFILIEEAYLKRQNNEHISKLLVDTGYDLMAAIVQPEVPVKGQVIPENDTGELGTGKFEVPEAETPGAGEESEGEDSQKDRFNEPMKRKPKQYGLGESPAKKVKRPDKLKKPTSVQPAIK